MTANPPRWVRRFEVTVSILTALVTIISAMIAWRAALASDAAGNADFAGMGAALNREEARILSSATTYQQYRAFTNYLRNNEIGNEINAAIDTAPEDQRDALASQRRSSWDQITIDSNFFSTRYLRSDSEGETYDTERQLGESAANAAQQKDVDPDSHFNLADRLRAKSNLLVGMLIIMAGALWFYTMAGEIKHGIRYLIAFLGLLCMLVGVIGTIVIEVI